MNRNVNAQISYDRLNKGVDIRESSTANFLVDSTDRVGYNDSLVRTWFGVPALDITNPNLSADFLISKTGQNLVTGFFTRFAMTEVELLWNLPNVTSLSSTGTITNSFSTDPLVATLNLGNNTTGLVLNTFPLGGPVLVYPNINIPAGNYTVKEALDAFVVALNAATNAVAVNIFSVVDSTTVTTPGVVTIGKKAIVSSGNLGFNFYRTIPYDSPNMPKNATYLNLAQSLGLLTFKDEDNATFAVQYAGGYKYNIAGNPYLNLWTYVDICSPQLASQQKLKDATTNTFDSNDVIYRWVFANDDTQPTSYDAYGYPILQGYDNFVARRYIQYPKQARWDPLIPLGQLQFQIFTDKNQLLSYRKQLDDVEFKMLMLISEV